MQYRLMATYRGTGYEAGVGPTDADVILFASSPPAEELGFEPAMGYWRKRVSIDDIDALWECRPVGRYRSHACLVLEEIGDRLHIAYLGHDAYQAERLGYWQVDRGVYEVVVPHDEVNELTEERVEYPVQRRPAPRPQAGSPPRPEAGLPPLSQPAPRPHPETGLPQRTEAGPPPPPEAAPAPQFPPAGQPFPDRTPAWQDFEASDHAGGIGRARWRGAEESTHTPGPPSPNGVGASGHSPSANGVATPGTADDARGSPASGTGLWDNATGSKEGADGPGAGADRAWGGGQLPQPAKAESAVPGSADREESATGQTVTPEPNPDPPLQRSTVADALADRQPRDEPSAAAWADIPDRLPPPRPLPKRRRAESHRAPHVPDSSLSASAAPSSPVPSVSLAGPADTSAIPGAPAPVSEPTGGGRRRKAPVETRWVFRDLVDMAAIPHGSYAVDEEIDGALCLIKTDDGYEVFSAIDGAKHEVRFFDDEEAAYFYLFGVLVAEALRSGRLAPKPG